MWSSISSYLYDESTDDAGESKAAPNRSPSKARIAATKNGNHRRDGHGRINAAAAATSGRGSSHGDTMGNKGITLQTSVHSTASNNSNSKRHVDKPAAPDNTTILRGIIVGEQQSGKTCLIRRLRGEDPFQSRGQGQPDDSDKNGNRREKRNLMALIPWKLPEEAPFHQKQYAADSEELVQLYISEGKSFCYSNKEKSFQKQWMSVLQSQRGKECNFVVWMIDPRMDHVLDFIQEGLDIVFPFVVRDKNGEEEEASAPNIKQPLIQNMCILLNFRDINPSQQEESQQSLVDQVQCILEEVIGRHNDHQKQNQSPTTATIPTPTILVYESSMENCYGLLNLHSFITLPYLSHRERELRRRAEQAQKQHTHWKEGLLESKVVEYSEFVKQRLGGQKQQTKQSLERQKLEEEKEQLQLQLRKQNQQLRSKIGRQEAVMEDDVSVGANQKVAAATPSMTSSSNRSEAGVKRETTPTHLNDIMGQRKLFAQSHQSQSPSVAKKSLPMTPSSNRSEEGVKRETTPTHLNDDTGQRKFFAKSHQYQSSSVAKKSVRASVFTEHKNLDSFFSDDEEEDDLVEAETKSIGNYSSDSSDDSDDDGDFFIDVSGTRCPHANAVPISHKKALPKQKCNELEKSPDLDIGPEVEGDKVEGLSNTHPGSKKMIDDKNSNENFANADISTKHSSSLELEDEEKTKGTTVNESSASDNHEVEKETDDNSINEPTLTDSRGTKDGTKNDALPTRNTLEHDTRSLQNPEEPDAFISMEEATNIEEAVTEHTTKKSFAGDNHDGSSDEPTSEHLDGSSDASNTKSGVMEDELKANHAKGNVDNEAEETLSEPDADISVEEDTNSEKAVSERSPEKSFAGDNHAGSPDEPTNGEQPSTDNSPDASNTKFGVMEHELKADHQKGNVDNDAEETISEPDADISVEEDTNSEKADSERSPKKSFAGDNHVGSSDEPTNGEQSSTDNSPDASNTKSGVTTDDLKEDHQKANVDNDAEETLSSDTAEYKQKQEHTELVMDSDDDSTGPRKEESTHDRKKKNSVESDESDEEFTIHNTVAVAHQSHESLVHTSTLSTQHNRIAGISGASVNSAPVSFAAMAAIEAAKREAEQMMAQTQPDALPNTKREKKNKKKKDGDRKKKKKKDKKPKD